MMITDHACGSLPADHADDQEAAAIPARGCAEDRQVADPGAAVVWACTMIWSAFGRSQFTSCSHQYLLSQAWPDLAIILPLAACSCQ
jgi:hypothetical protein